MTEGLKPPDTGAFDEPALRPLRPWAEAFSEMPDDQTRVIGAFLAALLPLVESADEARKDGLSELDSFDDLVAAGPLDRLITSELVWLNAMPAEFIRRLGEGEALRRRAVYRDLADDRAIVALIDSGPEMLGRRRLVALGALLALGVAARRRGARLIWSATGFTRAPVWLEGLDRRGLSRFAHQTGYEPLTPALCDRWLAQAPDSAALETGDFWVVSHGDWRPPDPAPTHRVEIEEIWPPDRADAAPSGAVPSDPAFSDPDPFGEPAAVDRAPDVPLRPEAARASVISETGRRQVVELAYPDEALCAATLRAPFRLPGSAADRAASASWAPSWFAQEADLGSFYARVGDEVVIRQSSSQALRLRLPPDAHLLGVRSAGGGRCVVVWREGDRLALTMAGRGEERAPQRFGALAPGSPLATQSHPAAAVPPAFRFGRKGAVAVAAPDGSLHELVNQDVGPGDGLLVTPLAQGAGLRVRARAQNRLLCEAEGEGEGESGGLLLMKPRDGRRQRLWLGPGNGAAKAIVSCFAIGDAGGALIVDADGARWAPPKGAADDQTLAGLAQPPVPPGAIVARVEALEHQSAFSTRSFAARSWAVWVWSRESGLQRLFYTGTTWRATESATPVLDGEPWALTMTGKTIFAMVGAPKERARLVEFRRDATGPAVESAVQPWYAEAACVAL